MNFRATLLGVPVKDPANPPKPQVIHSNSMEDVQAWTNAQLGMFPKCWVVVDKQEWKPLLIMRGVEVLLDTDTGTFKQIPGLPGLPQSPQVPKIP